MNYWHIQANRNAAIDRGVAVSHPEFPNWVFYVRPDHGWNYHFSRAAARIAVSRPEIVELFSRLSQPGYIPTPDDQALRYDVELQGFAEGNIAHWENVTDEHGEEIDFTPARAANVFAHFRQLYEFLRDFAAKPENFPALAPATKAALAEGNSAAGSSSSSARGVTIGERSRPATNGAKARPRL